MALAEYGGYAEKVCVDATQCFKLPITLRYVDAAAMALVYDTSWFAFRERGQLAPVKRFWCWAARWNGARLGAARQSLGSADVGWRFQS